MASDPPLDNLRAAMLLVVVLALFFVDMPGAGLLGLIVWAALMVFYYRRPHREGRDPDEL